MFSTINYKSGWIQIANFNGIETFQARAPGVCLGDFKSLQACKLAITRYDSEVKKERATDDQRHHALIQSIVKGF